MVRSRTVEKEIWVELVRGGKGVEVSRATDTLDGLGTSVFVGGRGFVEKVSCGLSLAW